MRTMDPARVEGCAARLAVGVLHPRLLLLLLLLLRLCLDEERMGPPRRFAPGWDARSTPWCHPARGRPMSLRRIRCRRRMTRRDEERKRRSLGGLVQRYLGNLDQSGHE